jgi:hypothetical protein
MLSLALLLASSCLTLSQEPLGEGDKGEISFDVEIWQNFSEPGALDRDEIAGWTLSASSIFHAGVHAIFKDRDESWFERTMALIPVVAIDFAIAAGSHEYGHFRAYSLAGMKGFQFAEVGNPENRFDADPLGAVETMANYFFFGGEHYNAAVRDEEWLHFILTPDRNLYTAEFEALAEAGGFNQQAYNAELLGKEMRRGRAHPLTALPYLFNAMAPMCYPSGMGGDVTDYVADLSALGVHATEGQVRLGSQLPKLFSGSTIASVRSLARFMASGDERPIVPLRAEVGEATFYWPEFGSSFTLHGPTVKVMEQIDFRNQSFAVTLEHSLSEELSEAGLGWQSQISEQFGFEATLYRNFDESGTWMEAGPVFKPRPWLSFGVKGYRGEGYTFIREMGGMVPSFLEDSEDGVKGFFTLSLSF